MTNLTKILIQTNPVVPRAWAIGGKWAGGIAYDHPHHHEGMLLVSSAPDYSSESLAIEGMQILIDELRKDTENKAEFFRRSAVERFGLPFEAYSSEELFIACQRIKDLEELPLVFECEWDCNVWDRFKPRQGGDDGG